jgi:phosphopantothenoylcysteine decarboxylase/phosphopantothenate--cysteine ligase
VAVAAAAWRRGAEVTLVHGPLAVAAPVGGTTVRVGTTEEMCAAVLERIGAQDVVVMAAAPADFRPRASAGVKLKKDAGPPALELEPTPDILLATRPARRPGAVIVGFALETGDATASAREKLARKGLDLVVANDATEPGAGFGVNTNRVTLVGPEGDERLPLLDKREVADIILDRAERLLEARDGR